MEPLDFRSFSHPGVCPERRAPLVSQLLIRDARFRARSFVRNSGSAAAASSEGLLETLSAWSESAATLAQAKGFPLSLRNFRKPGLDPAWVAASGAIHLHANGYDGEWSAKFATPAPVPWDTFISPPVRGVFVSAQRGEFLVRVVAEDGSKTSLTNHAPADAVPPQGWSAMARAQLPNAAELTIFDAVSRATIPIGDPFTYALQASAGITASLQQMGELLQSYAPHYLGWVADGMFGLVPVAPPSERGNQSASVAGIYGIPYVSFPRDPLNLAEDLVHETSHQYFHYTQIDTLLTNGQDKQMYPSPYVGKDRPISRILIAFHAFANVAIFYRDCLAAGMKLERDKAEREIAFNLPILTRFAEALDRSPGLSDAGRSLFEPLRDKLLG